MHVRRQSGGGIFKLHDYPGFFGWSASLTECYEGQPQIHISHPQKETTEKKQFTQKFSGPNS